MAADQTIEPRIKLEQTRILTKTKKKRRKFAQKNKKFSQMVLALAWPFILGLDRIETASLLRCNGNLQFLTDGGAKSSMSCTINDL
jgi:hypothetical protein